MAKEHLFYRHWDWGWGVARVWAMSDLIRQTGQSRLEEERQAEDQLKEGF